MATRWSLRVLINLVLGWRMYKIIATKQFCKDVKLLKKRKVDMSLIDGVVRQLAEGKELASKHRDHALTGNYMGYRECHIKPDLLLIYKKDKKKITIYLIRSGSHSDLF